MNNLSVDDCIRTEMKTDRRGIMAYIKKILIFLLRTYRSACEHPFILGMLFFLLTLYICLPSVFRILVSFSPTIVCTFLLLGTLLTYGQPSVPAMEGEEETTDDLSPLQVGSTSNELVVKKQIELSMLSHTETSRNANGIFLRESNIIEQENHVCEVKHKMLLSASKEEEENNGGSVGTCSLLEQDENQIQFDKIASDSREVKALSEKSESLEEFQVRDAQQVVHPVTSREKETENLKVEMHKPMMERGLDSSLDLSKKLVCSNDVSKSDSFHTEAHPPDGLLADSTWMIKELHPIIDCGAPHLVSTSMDDSHSLPRSYALDCRCDSNMEEKPEHMESPLKEKNGQSAIPATCTADEDMNHMDLSSSMRVRTKRLKSLIIKRRARKNLRDEAERSLQGLDINKTAAMLDELKHIQLHIPLVSRGKNPFGLPSNSEDELDPPGSAPSALPRGNIFDEFDLPFDQEDENSLLTDVNLGHQCPTSLPQKDPLFRRYESFTVGTSFTSKPRQKKHDIKLLPDSGSGSTILEEASYADFQRQLSDESLSNTVSMPASESNALVIDRNYDDPVEQELHQESLAKLIFPCDDAHIRKESSPSDEVDFIESLGREKEIGIYGIDDDVGVNTPTDFEEGTHETFDDFEEYEKKLRYEMELHLPTSDTANSDLSEVRYMESNSTSSLEVSKNISIKPEEKSMDLQQSIGDHLKGPHYSVHSSSREGETLNDFHFDSSPSVTRNSASFGSDITLSIASETQTESLDLCVQGLEEKNNGLCAGDLASSQGYRGEKAYL